jgi:hypothetical protein
LRCLEAPQSTTLTLTRVAGGGTDEEKRLVDVPVGGSVVMEKPLTAEQVQSLDEDAAAGVQGELWSADAAGL